MGDRGEVGPFLENRPSILEQNEQVRGAVEVDVDDLTRETPARRVELFDQIRAVVEVPIQLAPDEHAGDIVLAFVRPTIKVPVTGILNELIVGVVDPPDIGPSIPISIVGPDKAIGRRKRKACARRAGQRARDRHRTQE
jgi:hypothetical protein